MLVFFKVILYEITKVGVKELYFINIKLFLHQVEIHFHKYQIMFIYKEDRAKMPSEFYKLTDGNLLKVWVYTF